MGGSVLPQDVHNAIVACGVRTMGRDDDDVQLLIDKGFKRFFGGVVDPDKLIRLFPAVAETYGIVAARVSDGCGFDAVRAVFNVVNNDDKGEEGAEETEDNTAWREQQIRAYPMLFVVLSPHRDTDAPLFVYSLNDAKLKKQDTFEVHGNSFSTAEGKKVYHPARIPPLEPCTTVRPITYLPTSPVVPDSASRISRCWAT